MAIKTTFLHQFFDDNGDPLSGGKVYFYETGTSTPKDTYTTSAATVANANPVILNSRGEAEIWTDGLYRIDVKTSADVQVTGYPIDNVGAGNANDTSEMRWCGTSTGSANAQILSPTTSITAYTAGQSFVFKAGYTNTGATTVAISGLAAIAIQNQGAALAANDILVNKFYTLVLDTATTAQLTIANANLAAVATLAATATVSNRVDSGEVTVTAHATTGDIFAAAANSILWDDSGGAITCTDFPDASKAGMTRELRCNGATMFTAGANMLIEGIPSGTTITLVSGALVKVRAITVSQFKLTYSLSGTFTATGTGFTVNPTTTASYTVENGWCRLTIPASALTGTSNATTFTVTGLPTCIVPVSAKYLTGGFLVDNGTASVPFGITISAGAAIITLSKGAITGGAWTASGTKTLSQSEFVYSLS